MEARHTTHHSRLIKVLHKPVHALPHGLLQWQAGDNSMTGNIDYDLAQRAFLLRV